MQSHNLNFKKENQLKIKSLLSLIWVNFLILSLLSCATTQQKLPNATQRAVTQAEKKGFTLNRYTTKPFVITAYERLPNTSGSLIHVYIEGDGHSWKTKHRISPDPTPRQPLALKLALQDTHPQVIYIARPCQYTPFKLNPHCDPKYWSSHRFSAEIIASFHAVLDEVKQTHHNSQFKLIGFSGGAGIAALIAAERTDVIGLITVAGDLDHVALSDHHHTTPLSGSRNPITVASSLKNLPQQHWSGEQDPTVPVWVAPHFAQAVANKACVKTNILPKAGHHRGWEKAWPDIIKRPLVCDP